MLSHLLIIISLLPSFLQANSNEIVLASTHDVQEVDVSTLVAVQPYTWIGDDFDKESRRLEPYQIIFLNVIISKTDCLWLMAHGYVVLQL